MRTYWLFLFLLVGCATPMTPEQLEYRTVMEAENWRVCTAMYENAGIATIHRDHRHMHNGRIVGIWGNAQTIRMDLNDNRCQRMMGEHWQDTSS